MNSWCNYKRLLQAVNILVVWRHNQFKVKLVSSQYWNVSLECGHSTHQCQCRLDNCEEEKRKIERVVGLLDLLAVDIGLAGPFGRAYVCLANYTMLFIISNNNGQWRDSPLLEHVFRHIVLSPTLQIRVRYISFLHPSPPLYYPPQFYSNLSFH